MYVDVGFGVLLLFGAIRGYRQGFAKQMVQLSGLVAALLLTESAVDVAWPLVGGEMTVVPESVREPVLFFALFASIVIAVWLLGAVYLSWYRQRTFGANKPSAGDHLFGVAPGLLKAAFLVCVLLYVADRFPALSQDLSIVKSQFDASTGVGMARDLRVVDRLLDSAEVRRLRTNYDQIAGYYVGAEEPRQSADREVSTPR